MTFPYSDDLEGEQVIVLARTAFQSPKIFAGSNRHLIFVCGGDSSENNLRSRFLEYATKELPHLRLILAEDAYRDLMSSSRPDFVNLAVFEHLVAELSDCVIVFPESFGSAAELGFFVAKEKITKKVLAANPIKYQARDSFLNMGPIALVNSSSNFRPTLLIPDTTPVDFTSIAERLARYATTRRREAFEHKNFEAYSPLEKLFVIFELVRHLRIVHVATLPYVIEKIFTDFPERVVLRQLLSILIAAKYVVRAGDDQRFLVASGAPPFLDIPGSTELLVAGNQYLIKNHRELYTQTFATIEEPK
jgi:hypothetical protein